MRVGKDSTPSRDSGSNSNSNVPSGSRSVDDASFKRRQSLSSAVSAFANELRSHTKKPGSTVLSRIAGASSSKSTDDLSLATAAQRSKSLTHLPVTNSASDVPLLTLVLSGTSFLDTTISESGERLYVIDTKGARTNISREDPVQGVAHVGAVNWLDDKVEDRPLIPKHRATIQMAHGRRYFVDEFLRRTKLTSSRLFNIPHYPHALKWKRAGGNFKLSVAKGKATVAILELQGTTPRIKVFDTLYEHDATHPLREHRGVPVLLLDYLVATALLITCEKDEWLAAGSGPSTAGSNVLGAIHRWRMEVQPDPEPAPEKSGSAAEDPELRSPSPQVSSSSVLDTGPSSSGSHVEVSSDPGVESFRRLSAAQSWQSGTRNSHLSTASPQLSTFSRLPPLSISTSTHPFSSEFGELTREDSASTVFSPLAAVLPPALGVSVGDSSPSGNTNPTVLSDSPRHIQSPDAESTVSIAGSSVQYSHGRSQSVESPIGLETPRQFSKSSPSSPMGMSTRRPTTAGAALGGSGGRRPFRPLPKPPVHAATLPREFDRAPPVPPVPNVPPGVRDGVHGLSENVRGPGSRFVSLDSSIASREEMNETGRLVAASSPLHANDAPRTIRRIASDVTLSAKVDTEFGSQSLDLDDRRESRYDRSPLLKEAIRRSIYKEPFPASSPSPTFSPTTSLSPTPTPVRTLSESSVPIAVPRTEPLRLRHPRPIPSDAGYDALLRAPSTSSSSYSHATPHQMHHPPRPSEYDDGRGSKVVDRLGQDDDIDSDEGESQCGAPPAYDTIDFSRPPLKTPGFRGAG